MTDPISTPRRGVTTETSDHGHNLVVTITARDLEYLWTHFGEPDCVVTVPDDYPGRYDNIDIRPIRDADGS
jgi:hypothetical protein